MKTTQHTELDKIIENINAGILAGVAEAKAKATMERMNEIVDEIPLCLEYETDARDRWPQRWASLQDWLKAQEKE